MKYLSVCSGIEAASVAWQPLGWEPTAFSEVAPFPCAVLDHHYPSVPNWGDMTKYEAWPDATFDLLCGGTPCQSFSIAGLRKGLDDPRGELMLTFGAIARRYRPRWLVWENVPNVMQTNGGRDFGTFLGLLAELGYGFAYRVLDAQYVRVRGYGWAVPQRRRRVFVVGYLGDWRRAAAVLFERQSLSGHTPPGRSQGARVATTLTRGADSSGKGGYAGRRQEDDYNIVAAALTANGVGTCGADDNQAQAWHLTLKTVPLLEVDKRQGKNADPRDGTGVGAEGDPMYTLQAGAQHGVYTLAIRGRDGESRLEYREDGTSNAILTPSGGRAGIGVGAVLAFGTTQVTSRENRSNPKPGDPCHTLSKGAHPPAIAFHGSQDPDISGDVTHPTGRNNGFETCAMVSGRVRRLTPRECERLQGFPDDYTRIPWRGKPASKCPDSPRYRAIGNSWAVNCPRWIGYRIEMLENEVRVAA